MKSEVSGVAGEGSLINIWPYHYNRTCGVSATEQSSGIEDVDMVLCRNRELYPSKWAEKCPCHYGGFCPSGWHRDPQWVLKNGPLEPSQSAQTVVMSHRAF